MGNSWRDGELIVQPASVSLQTALLKEDWLYAPTTWLAEFWDWMIKVTLAEVMKTTSCIMQLDLEAQLLNITKSRLSRQ